MSTALAKTDIIKTPSNISNQVKQTNGFGSKYLYPIRVEENGKALYGYIDETGKVIAKPKWDGCENFTSNGVGRVFNYDTHDGSYDYGIVDYTGREIIPIKKGEWNYTYLGPEYIICSGYEDINMGGFKSVIYDMSGKIVFETDKPVDKYINGYFTYNENSVYGKLDKTGKVIETKVYDRVELAEKMYDSNSSNNKDKLKIYKDDYKYLYGLKDSNGEVIVQAKYGSITEHDNGETFLCTLDSNPPIKSILLDKNGKIISPKDASFIEYYGNGMYLVCFDKDYFFGMRTLYKYAVFDVRTGNISQLYYVPQSAGIVENADRNTMDIDIVSVYDGNKSFIIGRDGKQIEGTKSFEGKWTISLVGNLIKVSSESHSESSMFFTYYDKNWKEIWKTNYEFDLGKERKLQKTYYSPNIASGAYYFQLNSLINKPAEENINRNIKKIIDEEILQNKEKLISIESDFLISKDLLTIVHTKSTYSGGGMGNHYTMYYHFDLNTGNLFDNLSFLKKGNNYIKSLQKIVKGKFDLKYKENGMYPSPGLDQVCQNNYLVPDGIVFSIDGYKFQGKVLVKFSEIKELIDQNAEIFKTCDLSKYPPYVDNYF